MPVKIRYKFKEDKKSDKELAKAIDHIAKSIDGKFWIDDITLDSKDGKKVFDEEKKAVKSLVKVDAIDISGVINSLVTLVSTIQID